MKKTYTYSNDNSQNFVLEKKEKYILALLVQIEENGPMEKALRDSLYHYFYVFYFVEQ